MSQTMLNIKMDAEIKREAQRVAKEMGVPLSLVVNSHLKKFIRERRIELQAPLVPNAKTQKILDIIEHDFVKEKKLAVYDGVDTMMKSLGL